MHNVHQIHDVLHFMPVLLAELFIGLVIGMLALIIEKSFMKLKAKI